LLQFILSQLKGNIFIFQTQHKIFQLNTSVNNQFEIKNNATESSSLNSECLYAHVSVAQEKEWMPWQQIIYLNPILLLKKKR